MVSSVHPWLRDACTNGRSLSSLTHKLVHRVIDYFETQLKVPNAPRRSGQSSPTGGLDGADSNEREMTGPEKLDWFAKILDSVRLRYRKLQHFTRWAMLHV